MANLIFDVDNGIGGYTALSISAKVCDSPITKLAQILASFD